MENGRERKGWGLFVLGLVIGLLVALIITSVIFKQNVSLSNDTLLDARVVEKIEDLENLIHSRYYLAEMTDEELEEGIYRGMLWALNDPYSEYYTAEELKELMDQSEGIYYGIGAHVGLDKETSLPMIKAIIEGTPAEEADLRPDDLIYMVDDELTEGLSLTETVALIKGPEGTKVTLTLIRDGVPDYLEVTIPRKKVESPTVNFKMLEDGMAYIEITEFDDVTVDQFADALAMAKGSDMKGLILDLRANPGGSLSAVVDIARMMLPEGMIVYTEDKAGKRSEYSCDGKRELQVPLVVLIDGNSASASEILAGAIQDYKLGTLVGTTTFGKGIVQQVIAMNDGSAIKLTISSYFTPKGRNIHGTGIEPDVECKFDSQAYYDEKNPYDNQLEKAKEVLKGML
ncbi:MAG: S41 family peptidase [Acetatifactor sp.]|nr:S41 family peptidase [Acetatifactor sp.]